MNIQKIGNVEIDLDEVATWLMLVSTEVQPLEESEKQFNDDEAYIDVRMQVTNVFVNMHSGLSDYDQSHEGYWGTSSVAADCDLGTAQIIAQDLFDQAADSYAMAESESERK